MRVVEEIAHPVFKITVFSWNGKYLIKIELDQYEQTFKIKEQDVMGTNDIKAMLNDAFLESCMHRFITMRQDFSKTFQSINNEA